MDVVSSPDLHPRLRKELPGGIRGPRFASFGRAILSWLGINVIENMISYLSLTLEDVPKSAAKIIAVQ